MNDIYIYISSPHYIYKAQLLSSCGITILLMKMMFPVFRKTIIPFLFFASLLNGCKRNIDSATDAKQQSITSGSYSVFTTEHPLQPTSDKAVELGMKFK